MSDIADTLGPQLAEERIITHRSVWGVLEDNLENVHTNIRIRHKFAKYVITFIMFDLFYVTYSKLSIVEAYGMSLDVFLHNLTIAELFKLSFAILALRWFIMELSESFVKGVILAISYIYVFIKTYIQYRRGTITSEVEIKEVEKIF